MLSRRDKLLVQPWEDRRFKDHRSKVAAALPAIDDRAPAPRPHVALKLKKWQRELERAARVQQHNYSLLQRLGAVMRVNRLDNHWRNPPPNFQHKVGRYYDERALRARLAPPLAPPEAPPARVRCYACDHNKMRHYEHLEHYGRSEHHERRERGPYAPREDSLPSIHQNPISF